MKFEIDFDENIYRKQMDLLFDLGWKKKTDFHRYSQYLGVLLIVIGISLLYDNPNRFMGGLFFLFIGLYNLLPFIYYYFKVKSVHKKFEIAKVKEVKFLKDNKKAIIEFTEKSFIMKVGDNTAVLDWEKFTLYLVKEDNLILVAKNYEPYILDKLEVGEINFEKIISFIHERIPLKLI
ncbi:MULTISPECIES: hypothetical protein [Flavobacterium]|uniref:hypothetical protein n=1 Tax=Flavobacterium TaxID=237 RepID=UPI00188BFD48|nr:MULTISPECIES: hypothetical protein [Flavobacterium]MBF4470985.1 hypothetical protein [Flavobacterium sp. HJJ]